MSDGHFNFFGLPAELRSAVYECYFGSSTATDFELLLDEHPNNAILATSKRIYKESIGLFKITRKQVFDCRHDLMYRVYFELENLLIASKGKRKHRAAFDASLDLTISDSGPYRSRHESPTMVPCCELTGTISPFTGRSLPSCNTCMRYMRLALYLSAFPHVKYNLLDNAGNGTRLNDAGTEIKKYINAHKVRPSEEFRDPLRFAVNFLRLELEKQRFIHLRYKIQLATIH